MRRIGVVTGSRIEARCLPQSGQFLVRCSAADPVRARAHADALVKEGVDALLSFGLAGGLDPALRPGDLLLPARVLTGPVCSPLTLALSPQGRGEALRDAALEGRPSRSPTDEKIYLLDAGEQTNRSLKVACPVREPLGEGETLLHERGGKGGDGAAIQTSTEWRKALITRLEVRGISYAIGPVVGSDLTTTSPTAKHALHAATGALAVDMESHAVAEAAVRHGRPFLVLRAVADPAAARLPEVALRALSRDGATDLLGLLRGLLARPSEIADLLRLARSSRRGLTALRRVAAVLRPDPGLP